VSLNISLSHSRSLKVIETGTIRKLGHGSYSPSILNIDLSCISSEAKRDIGRKSGFFIPLALDASVREVPSEYCPTVWYEKTGMAWLLDGVQRSRTSITVSTEYRRVTDGQTSCDGIVRAMHSIAQ